MQQTLKTDKLSALSAHNNKIIKRFFVLPILITVIAGGLSAGSHLIQRINPADLAYKSSGALCYIPTSRLAPHQLTEAVQHVEYCQSPLGKTLQWTRLIGLLSFALGVVVTIILMLIGKTKLLTSRLKFAQPDSTPPSVIRSLRLRILALYFIMPVTATVLLFGVTSQMSLFSPSSTPNFSAILLGITLIVSTFTALMGAMQLHRLTNYQRKFSR